MDDDTQVKDTKTEDEPGNDDTKPEDKPEEGDTNLKPEVDDTKPEDEPEVDDTKPERSSDALTPSVRVLLRNFGDSGLPVLSSESPRPKARFQTFFWLERSRGAPRKLMLCTAGRDLVIDFRRRVL